MCLRCSINRFRNDKEFIAPKPSHVIIAANGTLKTLAECPQHRIAYLMSMFVVDLFEVIEVDEQHSDGRPATRCSHEALFQLSECGLSVSKLRQTVMRRLVRKSAAKFFTLIQRASERAHGFLEGLPKSSRRSFAQNFVVKVTLRQDMRLSLRQMNMGRSFIQGVHCLTYLGRPRGFEDSDISPIAQVARPFGQSLQRPAESAGKTHHKQEKGAHKHANAAYPNHPRLGDGVLECVCFRSGINCSGLHKRHMHVYRSIP